MYNVKFTADGKYLVSGSKDSTVKIWDMKTYKCLATLEGHNSGVYGMSFSPDGQYLATGEIGPDSEDEEDEDSDDSDDSDDDDSDDDDSDDDSDDSDDDNSDDDDSDEECLQKSKKKEVLKDAKSVDSEKVCEVKIWNFQTRECLATLKGHTDRVNSVGFSADGNYLASGSEDSTVKIWNAKTFECLKTLEFDNQDIECVCFSNDGKYLATATGGDSDGDDDNVVKIWNAQTFECLTTLKGHTDNVSSVAFSPDGKYLVSGSHDTTVKIWDLENFKCLATLEGHTEDVTNVSLSPDGKQLVSAAWDTTVRIWINIEGKWFCDKVLSACEAPLTANRINIDKITISNENMRILERFTKIAESEVEKYDESKDELKHNSELGQSTAKELSKAAFQSQITKYEELSNRKFVKLNL